MFPGAFTALSFTCLQAVNAGGMRVSHDLNLPKCCGYKSEFWTLAALLASGEAGLSVWEQSPTQYTFIQRYTPHKHNNYRTMDKEKETGN